MNNFQEEERIAALIRAYMAKNISEAEQNVLNEWLRDQNNARKFMTITNHDNLLQKEEFYRNLNTERAFEKLQLRIANDQKTIRYTISPWIKYAAVITLLIGISGLWFFLNTSKTDNQLVVLPKPGEQKAVLILGNGSRLTLDKNSDQIIRKDSSVINTNNILVYNTQNTEAPNNELNTLIVPIGGMYSLTLSDGTRVWMNSESELTYPVKFNANERSVRLKGEGYFEVTHNAEKPFRVITESGNITVLGTEFNVSAYEEDIEFATTLINGKVALDHLKGRMLQDSATVVLAPGERAVFNRSFGQNISINTVDTELYTAWKDGKFYFKNENLNTILTKVARWYDVTVTFTDPSLKKITFTGAVLKDQPLDYLMELISQSSNINYTINKNQHHYEVTILKK
ncbi:FecR family protein [Robertkochia solimangrovi]|uniref:FecR family protein n=1 Tax=Robertkochia solimangrovi TaxID=2213046 RepID=UPI00118066D3|nr:FecR domain-containing protein [Robertkochia solimangrovi]TRZ41291.1 hypothetical protein DMZ48_17840 [Robertkochia solimangrovi]